MNAVIMDNVRIGNECIVGALAFVPADTQWDDRQVIVGNPAKAVKQVSDEMITWKSAGTAIYQALPAELHASLKEVEALREIPADRPTFTGDYPSWDELKKR
jgi:phenylacetic acid degradation protein